MNGIAYLIKDVKIIGDINMAYSLLEKTDRIEKAGALPEGNYTFELMNVIQREKVVSIFPKNADKAFLKAINNKERANLSDELIAQIEAYDLGPDGNFDDGRPKPRFQNQIQFDIKEVNSKTDMKFSIYGGPKINSALEKFITRSLGITKEEIYKSSFGDLFKIGDQFNITLKAKGDFANVDINSVRKVGLPPIEEGDNNSEPVNDAGFTQYEQALLKYLQTEGKGMPVSDITTLHNKGIVSDGIALDSYGAILSAWGKIRNKIKSFKDTNGNIDIVL